MVVFLFFVPVTICPMNFSGNLNPDDDEKNFLKMDPQVTAKSNLKKVFLLFLSDESSKSTIFEHIKDFNMTSSVPVQKAIKNLFFLSPQGNLFFSLYFDKWLDKKNYSVSMLEKRCISIKILMQFSKSDTEKSFSKNKKNDSKASFIYIDTNAIKPLHYNKNIAIHKSIEMKRRYLAEINKENELRNDCAREKILADAIQTFCGMLVRFLLDHESSLEKALEKVMLKK
jgi:hypothetical protein